MPEGYVIDPEIKTFYVEYGGTSQIEWKNTPTMGQIQIVKKSADDNQQNALPAGSVLPGAVFEIRNRAGDVVETVATDSAGRAVSKALLLGRYTVRETKAPDFYVENPSVFEAEIEFSGQIIRIEVLDKSIETGVSIQKRGYAEAVPNQTIRYDFKNIANESSVPLESVIRLGCGVVQIGLSLQSHDPIQRSNGFLTFFSGVMIALAKEILTLLGVS